MSWVLPGVLLTLASFFCPVMMLIALDFPAFERPQNATSVPTSGGQLENVSALLIKRA